MKIEWAAEPDLESGKTYELQVPVVRVSELRSELAILEVMLAPPDVLNVLALERLRDLLASLPKEVQDEG